MSSRKLLAVDLDGTLIRGNTLHIYIRCALKDMLRRRRLYSLAYSAAMLALRRAGRISHSRMKFGILSHIKPTARLRADFRAATAPLRNKDVERLISDFRARGGAVLLASAAADSYIPLIWDGDFVATDMNPATNPGHIECRGEEKLRRVHDYAATKGLTLCAAISDDARDDAPLLQAAPEAFLVSDGKIIALSR